MTPVFLNLHGRLCVVVGGGPVGRRKAATLLEDDARVRLVCLEPRPADETNPELDWRTEPYQANHLSGAALAFAAASPDVNRCVLADAHALGLWVNAATEPDSGDFFMPATLRRDGLILAVGTSGAAPALAREVRDLLDGQLDQAFGQWAALLGELRPLIRSTIPVAEWRRALSERLSRPEWLERLRRESPDQVRVAMLAEVRALADALPAPL